VLRQVQRFSAGLVFLCGLLGLLCFAYVVMDVRSFEWATLWRLLGLRGAAFVVFLAAGLALLTWQCARVVIRAKKMPRRRSLWISVALATWLFAITWLASWVFLEKPISVMAAEGRLTTADLEQAAARAVRTFTADGSLDALAEQWPSMDRDQVAVMLARIAVNRPSVFGEVSIGRTIVENASHYGVSPVLLLHWCYIDSFYGEAPAGPMPFFAEINGEMFRDLVQAHLPWWFVESPLRVALIEGPWFSQLAPETVSFKLRYAVQKATYDIAIAPFMNSVMSDLFLILREYPEEFPELFSTTGASDPLASSFLALRDDGLLEPYHDPYIHTPRTADYYDRNRASLITFGRAAVYRLIGDFAFATKVQALVARYYSEQYRERLGPGRWDSLTERQQTALLAMLRDVYTPSVGRISYNLYMVPEFNTTPIVFLAGEAARDFSRVLAEEKIWIPSDSTRLWGATGLMLRVLGETWGAATGEPLAGFPPTRTVEDSLKVLARHY